MTRIYLAVAALAVALTVTAVALAAPKQGTWLAKLSSDPPGFGPQSGIFRMAEGPSIRNGKQLRYIIVPVGSKCGTTVSLVRKKIRVRKGRFTYRKGAYLNPGGSPTYKGKLTWTGRFTTRKRVKGTVRFQSPVTPKTDRRGETKYQRKPCDSGTLKWRGSWQD